MYGIYRSDPSPIAPRRAAQVPNCRIVEKQGELRAGGTSREQAGLGPYWLLSLQKSSHVLDILLGVSRHRFMGCASQDADLPVR